MHYISLFCFCSGAGNCGTGNSIVRCSAEGHLLSHMNNHNNKNLIIIYNLILKQATSMQGEMQETVRALDLGVKAAADELDAAQASSNALVTVILTAKPEPASHDAPSHDAASAKVGSLKNSAAAARLQAAMPLVRVKLYFSISCLSPFVTHRQCMCMAPGTGQQHPDC